MSIDRQVNNILNEMLVERPGVQVTQQVVDETHVISVQQIREAIDKARRYEPARDSNTFISMPPALWQYYLRKVSDAQLLRPQAHRELMIPFEFVQAERERRLAYRSQLTEQGMDDEAIDVMIALGGYPEE